MKKLTKKKEDIADEVSDGDDKDDVLRGNRKRTPSTKLKDSKFLNPPLEKKKAVSTKFVKKTATQKRKHSKEVGKKLIKALNRLEVFKSYNKLICMS